MILTVPTMDDAGMRDDCHPDVLRCRYRPGPTANVITYRAPRSQPMADNDHLEGEALDFRSPPVTHNARRPWVILFASVLNSDRATIRARAEEWRQLFGGTGHA